MYIDLILLIVLLVIVIFVFRKFSSFVYGVAIIDVFLRIMGFLVIRIPLNDLKGSLPTDIPAIFAKYAKGDFYTILLWLYVFIYTCFLFYTVQYFIKKRK